MGGSRMLWMSSSQKARKVDEMSFQDWDARDGIVGKRIWMTGGASGIGKAIAEGLVVANCGGIAIVDLLEEEEGQMVCKKLATQDTRVIYYRCDVRDRTGILSCMKAATEAMCGLDIVINNAGIVDEDSLERSMAVNVTGVVNGTEAAIRLGVSRVINMGSAAGVFALPEGPYYSASKHAVVGYSRSVGDRVKGKVEICCICPGFIETGIGVGRGWTNSGVGIMKVETFVKFFLKVMRGKASEYGGGRVLYVSQKLCGREVTVNVRTIAKL